LRGKLVRWKTSRSESKKSTGPESTDRRREKPFKSKRINWGRREPSVIGIFNCTRGNRVTRKTKRSQEILQNTGVVSPGNQGDKRGYVFQNSVKGLARKKSPGEER